MASQAKYMDPMLWPRRVKRGHVDSSTTRRESRKTKWRSVGSSVISNLVWKKVWESDAVLANYLPTLTFAIICSFDASVSPVYTMLTTVRSVRCIAAMAVQSTRSPPPPALLSTFVVESRYLCKPEVRLTNMGERIQQYSILYPFPNSPVQQIIFAVLKGWSCEA